MSAQSPKRRVAVTGLGALSPGGAGVSAYRAWRESAGAGVAGGARIPDFEPARYIGNPKRLRSMHRTFQLVAAAAVAAMRAAGLPSAESLAAAGVLAERAGISAALADLSPLTPDLLQVVAQTGPLEGQDANWAQFAELSLHQLHPFRRLTLLANMAAAHTSLMFGLQGPSFTFTTGAAAGAQTVAEAYWTIAHDRADLMLCQTAESPEQAFTAHPRAEVAGALVLESWQQADRRGAPVVAELRAAGDGALPNPRFALSASGEVASEISPALGLMAVLLRLEAARPNRAVELSELLALPSERLEVPA